MKYSRFLIPAARALSCLQDKVIMRVRAGMLLALSLPATLALAQEEAQQPAREELDVTMQIIADPNAKQPDEVVRRIPLPARKPPTAAGEQRATPDAAAKGQERASEARESGREVSESAKERAQEAAEQREQARRSEADERRRNPGPAEPPRPPRPTPPRP